MSINLIPFMCLLLPFVVSQEILTQELAGNDRKIKKQERQVPRYYLCGAGAWKKRQFTPASQKCQVRCWRRTNRWGKRYCSWVTDCHPIPEVHHWTRINGLRFKFCHFQDWNNQFEKQEVGNYEWQGMKMCPQGMYVYGMRTKLSQRDGLAGLIIHCRNIRSTNHAADVLIFDGQGAWRESVVSADYAVGFQLRMREAWVYGIKLWMAPIPYIFAFSFKYQFPKNFNTAPSQIQKVTVTNLGATPMTKQIQMSRQKQFQRIWQNDKGQLHGQSISQLSSQTLRTKVRIGIPFLSQSKSITQKHEITTSNREQRFQTFKFGNTDVFKIGQKQKDIVQVPPCTRYSIIQTVYVTDSDIPYILQIGYSNGQEVQYENINGMYRGVAVGEVDTSVQMTNICNKPN